MKQKQPTSEKFLQEARQTKKGSIIVLIIGIALCLCSGFTSAKDSSTLFFCGFGLILVSAVQKFHAGKLKHAGEQYRSVNL